MKVPVDVMPLIRKFANNSFRYLFHQPDNAEDLLRWREPKLAQRIDFGSLTVAPDTFVAPDFAALESDVLLRAPFRFKAGPDGTIEVFILIEHQSEPDELIVFRVIRYAVLVYERQASDWLKTHSNLREFEFDPVWPIVFYSGTRTWRSLKPMAKLVRGGKLFEKRLPTLEPDFVNLATTSAAELQSKIGTFGWALWLIQQRKRKPDVFRDVLTQVIRRVDELGPKTRGRWKHLLWFAHALVYHAREGDERHEMAEFIRATVRASEQTEVGNMGKTIAEVLIDEGMEKGALAKGRETLVRQLRKKFKQVPAAIIAEIDATEDIKKLDEWLDAFATAKKFSDIPFAAHS